MGKQAGDLVYEGDNVSVDNRALPRGVRSREKAPSLPKSCEIPSDDPTVV